MNKKLMTILTVLAISALLASGAYAGRIKQIEVGDGQVFTTLPPDSTWNEMMSVSVTPKKGVKVCVVCASWTAVMRDNYVQTTLATQPNALGPWVQGYVENEVPGTSYPTAESGMMTQAFAVTPLVPVTFYMNGRNFGNSGGGSSVTMENTRIWAICGKGGIPSAPTSEVPEGAGTMNK